MVDTGVGAGAHAYLEFFQIKCLSFPPPLCSTPRWGGMAESSARWCLLGFSGIALLCPVPRCICPLRAGIKKVLRAGWSVVPPHTAARSWTDRGWWFQPGSAKEPTGARAPCQHFKRLHRNYTFTQGEDTQTTQTSSFLAFVGNCKSVWFHASAKFWLAVNDIIGISETGLVWL